MFSNDRIEEGVDVQFLPRIFFPLPLERRDKGPVESSGGEPDSSLFDDLRANEPTHSR